MPASTDHARGDSYVAVHRESIETLLSDLVSDCVEAEGLAIEEFNPVALTAALLKPSVRFLVTAAPDPLAFFLEQLHQKRAAAAAHALTAAALPTGDVGAYLEKHDLPRLVERALQKVCEEQPEDPTARMAQLLTADAAVTPRDDDDDDAPAAGKEGVKFAANERIVILVNSALADATVVRHLGGSKHEVRLRGNSQLQAVELNPYGCCRQRFQSAAAYATAATALCAREAKAHEDVEDGITGNRLRIKDQLLFITTENEAGSVCGSFFDPEGRLIEDGSTLRLELAGEREGECIVAVGPSVHVDRHPQLRGRHANYGMYPPAASGKGKCCVVRLEGPPSSCRLVRVDEETGETDRGMYVNSSRDLTHGEGAFEGMSCAMDDGVRELSAQR